MKAMIAGVLLLLAATAVRPAHAQIEITPWVIDSFHSEIEVREDGTVRFVEDIAVNFKALTDRHGIYRDLRTQVRCAELEVADRQAEFECPSGGNRLWEYTIESVTTADGTALPYTIEAALNAQRVRIGDPNTTVQGKQSYRITYTAKAALDAFADHDELYWSLTGQWTEPQINRYTARVTLPAGAHPKASCLEGVNRDVGNACRVSVEGDTVSFASTRTLYMFEQVMVAASFDKGAVDVQPWIVKGRGNGAGTSPAQAQIDVTAWVIESFHSEIEVKEDGTVRFVEDLSVNFKNLPEKHGIFRDLRYKMRCIEVEAVAGRSEEFGCPEGSDRHWEYHIESVTNADGKNVPYKVETLGDNKRIRIGDADKTVQGIQTYRITYTAMATLNPFPDHDEFYWNVTGQWPEAQINEYSARVKLPVGARPSGDCYEGVDEDSSRACRVLVQGDEVNFAATRTIYPYEQVTVAVSFSKGVVTVQPWIVKDRVSIDDFFTLDALEYAGAVGVGVASIAGVVGLWWVNGRDRRYKSIHYLTADTQEETAPLFGGHQVVVEYLPPEDLRPGQMGVILNEKADTLDVTATIVDLAVRGYLRIKELPKKGWLAKHDWEFEKLKAADAELLPYEKRLFNALFRGREAVKVSALKLKFAKDLEKVKGDLYKDALERKWFSASPTKSKGLWALAGILVMMAGAGLAVLTAMMLERALVGAGLVLGGLALLAVSPSMSRRTATGSEALRRVLGFRRYIDTAETRRQEFNEQENIFARYLPFAMVFGCVDKWAKAFEGLEDEAARATSNWYVGTAPFHIAAFSSGMSGFASSVGSTMASTPGGSGGSGGGGGGSAGGGGGGGGGGSW